MTTAMSKRNQARNEKALQDLLKTVPGNDRCADCAARNPGWASWSLGIFLCMRCAALHRKLGTHISKVKSLSMDSWTNEQVDNMKNIGNIKSNQIFNPRGKAPIVPIDQDEVDGAVEWFIRQKYIEKSFQEGSQSTRVQQIHRNQTFGDREPVQSSRSPAATEDEPATPSIPTPKSGKKFSFGLRSASSTFNLGKKNRERKASLPAGKVVGATIGLKEEGLEWKLVTLKEMGFPDEKRNTEILKGMNGDLERAVESLVRLGQGPARPGLVKKVSTTFASSASLPSKTQKPPPSTNSTSNAFGASFQQSPENTGFSGGQSSASSPGYRKTSNNPFDTFQAQPTQSSQSTIDQAFNNMTISQPLSSQSTGILPSQQAAPHAVYQQSMTPPPMSNGQNNYGYNPYMQQQIQPLQAQATGYNPYLQGQQQYNQQQYNQQLPTTQSNPFMPQQLSPQQTSNPFFQQQQQQQPQVPTSNPFFQQQSNTAYGTNAQYQQQPQYSGQQGVVQSPTGYQDFQNATFGTQQQQQQQQPQQQYQVQPQQHSQQQQQQPQQQYQVQAQQQQNYGFSNPYMQPQPQYNPQDQQQQFQQNQFAQQPLMPQATGRMNKQSILALYNNMQPSIPEHPDLQPQQQHVPQRSVTMPTMSTGTNNPFGSAAPGVAMQSQAGSRMNRDSIFAGTDDPFASLSSKIR